MPTTAPTTPKEIIDRGLERRVDLIAHALRIGVGLLLLGGAWWSDVAGNDRVAFTVFVVVFYLPLSPFDYLLTPRFGGRTWFDGMIAAGHTTSVFTIAWLLPSLQVVAMIGYLVIVVVFTENSGRVMGLVVTAFAAPLAVVANALAPREHELAWGVLVMFVVGCLFLTVLVHAVTAERALKARELEASLDAERRERLRAEAAKAAKDRFVESVTHELRTPLAVVMASLALLESERLGPDDRRMLLSKASDRTRDLDRILVQVMDYTNVESSLQGDPQLTPVAPLIARAVEAGGDVLAERQPTIDCDDGLVLWADPGAAQRVISLVVDNALKFSPPSTPIDIAATHDEDDVLISIADSGRGIDGDDLERVFEPFHQSGEVLPGTMGIGIGLTLARQLCEHHNGAISLRSTPGAGTTVLVRFPAPQRSD